MRIAFVNFEFPPELAVGGIAAYSRQASRLLRQNGHHVEVFCASFTADSTRTEDGVRVHRLKAYNHVELSERAAGLLVERDREVHFDVLETPEYGADALTAIRRLPHLPLVVKLHTPRWLVAALDAPQWPPAAAAEGGAPPPPEGYDPECDRECRLARLADMVAAPSRAAASVVERLWGLDPRRISYFPMPCYLMPALLQIPIRPGTGRVTFLGRLEVRKGVLDLARAIPLVLRDLPEIRFRFAGRPMSSPDGNPDMRAYLETMLAGCEPMVEWMGHVPPEDIPATLAQTDVCVFPSLWESYGLVCLEAMFAGRAVVATAGSGMAELLDGGRAGRLIPANLAGPGPDVDGRRDGAKRRQGEQTCPKVQEVHRNSIDRPTAIAEAVRQLLENPAAMIRLGEAARLRALAGYTPEYILPRQEECYRRAIQWRRRLGPRRDEEFEWND